MKDNSSQLKKKSYTIKRENSELYKPKKMTSNSKVSDEEVAAALKVKKGMLTLTAEILGIAKSTLTERIQRSPYLKEVLDNCKEKRIDIAELYLSELTEEKNLNSITFLLKTLGKKRGYVENTEVSVDPETMNSFNALMQQMNDLQERNKDVQEGQ